MNARLNMGAYGGTNQASLTIPNGALLTDVDNDDITNLVDFANVASMWNSSGNGQFCDFDRDNDVDIADLDMLIQEWLSQTVWY